MRPELTREHVALQEELRAYFARMITAELQAEIKGSEARSALTARRSSRWVAIVGSASAGRSSSAGAA
jgi:hypothetical protein